MGTLDSLGLDEDTLFTYYKSHIHEKNAGTQASKLPIHQELKELLLNSPCSSLLELIKEISSGDLLVYPTDTIYGLGTTIHSREGTERVFSIKKRPATMPLSLSVPSKHMIDLMAEVDERAGRLIRSFLPGPLTLVLKARGSFWKGCAAADSFIKDGKVGLRYLPDPFFNTLLWFTGPISSTSANRHGTEELRTLSEIISHFGNSVENYAFWNSAHHAAREEDWMRTGTVNSEKGERYLYREEKEAIDTTSYDTTTDIKASAPPFSSKLQGKMRDWDRTMKREEGRHEQPRSSTVVELIGNELRVLREGAISRKAIEEKLHES